MKKLFIYTCFLIIATFFGCQDPYIVKAEDVPSYEETIDNIYNNFFFSQDPRTITFYKNEKKWLVENINPIFRKYPGLNAVQTSQLITKMKDEMGNRNFNKAMEKLYKKYPYYGRKKLLKIKEKKSFKNIQEVKEYYMCYNAIGPYYMALRRLTP